MRIILGFSIELIKLAISSWVKTVGNNLGVLECLVLTINLLFSISFVKNLNEFRCTFIVLPDTAFVY